jgi:hypothetical protein
MVIDLLHYRSGGDSYHWWKAQSPYKEVLLSFWSADDAAERRTRSGSYTYWIAVFKNCGGSPP